jgi:hypothetical protein
VICNISLKIFSALKRESEYIYARAFCYSFAVILVHKRTLSKSIVSYHFQKHKSLESILIDSVVEDSSEFSIAVAVLNSQI